MWRGLLALGIAATMLLTVQSQQSNEPAPAKFDVASIKRNTSGTSNLSAGVTPGGYSATNVPLRFLVMSAFGVRHGQVTGGPDWIDRVRFDVVARAPEGAAALSMLPRLRELLRERFKLVAHLESREQPIFVLVRTGRRASSTLRPSTLDCSPAGTPGNPCRLSGTIGAVSGSVKGLGQTMADFAAYLGNNAGRVVVDRTGLIGRFDFELAWTADDISGLVVEAATPTDGSDRGVIFTALGEQLGLALEPERGPVEFLVIDSVAQPSEN